MLMSKYQIYSFKAFFILSTSFDLSFYPFSPLPARGGAGEFGMQH